MTVPGALTGRSAGPGRYRAAIVGLGRIASSIDEEFAGGGILLPLSHMGAYHEVDSVEVVGVADLDPAARARFVDRWGLPPSLAFESFEEMVRAARPDIVSVCTTAGPRAGIVTRLAAMRREGASVRAVWAEKPLATCLSDADEVVAACDAAGVVLVANTQKPLEPQVRLLRALLAAGAIGEPQFGTGVYQGHLSHNGVHMLAMLCALLDPAPVSGGRVAEVSGEVVDPAEVPGDEDFRAHAHLRLTNGTRAFLRAGVPGRTTSLEIVGTAGTLTLSDFDGVGDWQLTSDVVPVPGARPIPRRGPAPRPSHSWSGSVGQVLDICGCLDGSTTPTTPGELARHLLEVAIAVRDSHRRGGRRVELPLADRGEALRSYDASAGGARSVFGAAAPSFVSGIVADLDREQLAEMRRLHPKQAAPVTE